VKVSGLALSFAALSWGFLQAPFLHIHPDDHDHPATPPVHTHYHVAQRASAPAIDAADDDAIELEWSAMRPSGIDFHCDLGIPEGASIAAPTFSSSVAIQVPQYRGHDPPDLDSKQPRAPPA
jgi:hypothetical protein